MNAKPETDTDTDATVSATSPIPFPATKKSRAVLVFRGVGLMVVQLLGDHLRVIFAIHPARVAVAISAE